MNRRGFTIIELIIVIAIMGILLVLAVVNLRGTQVNARDEQRKANVEAIASHIEVYYRSGTDTSSSVGSYPSTDLIGKETTYLRDLDSKSLISPSSTTTSFVAATNATATTAGVTPVTGSGNDVYIYQPLKVDGSLCTLVTDECRKFNMYYWSENTNTIIQLQSRNQ
jgi:prepilin-type N-terminal cleavage/methylation domain-containing protein